MDKEIILEKFKLACHMTVSNVFIEELTVKVAEEFLEERMVYMFKSILLGENLGEVIIQHPATWWDAFKERWFPELFLRKWPVKYTKYHANQRVMYPQLQVPSLKSEAQIFSLTRTYE